MAAASGLVGLGAFLDTIWAPYFFEDLTISAVYGLVAAILVVLILV